jgi:hypothetical protein
MLSAPTLNSEGRGSSEPLPAAWRTAGTPPVALTSIMANTTDDDLKLTCWILGDLDSVTVTARLTEAADKIKKRVRRKFKQRFATVDAASFILHKISIPTEEAKRRFPHATSVNDVLGADPIESSEVLSKYYSGARRPEQDHVHILVTLPPPCKPLIFRILLSYNLTSSRYGAPFVVQIHP